MRLLHLLLPLLFISVAILAILLRIRRRRGEEREGFAQMHNTLATSSDYKAFYEWSQDFCPTWDQVIDNAMKTDQTSLTKEEYISELEGKEGKRFARCNLAIVTQSPDPIRLIEDDIVPTSIKPYEDTLIYMGKEISKIKQQTEAALQGQKIPSEGFQNIDSSCNPCIQEDPETVQKKEAAVEVLLPRLQELVPQLERLRGQLTVVKVGINDLNVYKQKAESGELINDVNIPDAK